GGLPVGRLVRSAVSTGLCGAAGSKLRPFLLLPSLTRWRYYPLSSLGWADPRQCCGRGKKARTCRPGRRNGNNRPLSRDATDESPATRPLALRIGRAVGRARSWRTLWPVCSTRKSGPSDAADHLGALLGRARAG